ncbi:hypothetical protein LSH36_1054g00006 [Paralvinella palmiformis]|uniref:Uncharacterized protein n=1 Tax=Paralvinella palmiformis TaxID=53620 RepID=A0AAD9IX54_9ANNE|nr:hypothetical protein LSH36_1054g00006 [Paralvinella palmiformis]
MIQIGGARCLLQPRDFPESFHNYLDRWRLAFVIISMTGVRCPSVIRRIGISVDHLGLLLWREEFLYFSTGLPTFTFTAPIRIKRWIGDFNVTEAGGYVSVPDFLPFGDCIRSLRATPSGSPTLPSVYTTKEIERLRGSPPTTANTRSSSDHLRQPSPIIGFLRNRDLQPNKFTDFHKHRDYIRRLFLHCASTYCNATWDGYRCWPATKPNTTVFQKCPNTSKIKVNDSGDILFLEAVAHRTCLASGEWLHGPWTNYTLCLVNIIYGLIDPEDRFFLYLPYDEEVDIQNYWKAVILRDIYFYGSILSFILLTLTLLIFTYFKLPMTSGLERMRLIRSRGDITRQGSGYLPPRTPRRKVILVHLRNASVYKRLYSAGRSSAREYMKVPVLLSPASYVTDHVTGAVQMPDWLCKLLTSILYYSLVANIFWMFVEGLFLHNRVAVSVFNTEAPFRIFYVIGWGEYCYLLLMGF